MMTEFDKNKNSRFRPPDFHGWLDKHFRRSLSFSVFFRIWLMTAISLLSIGGLSYYAIEKIITPQAKRVVEDSLVDTSRLLAVMLSADTVRAVAGDGTAFIGLQNALDDIITTAHTPAWYDKKSKSQYHLYITDNHGIVLYDSLGESVGQDFSQWNDIYLTLKGHYGARSSKRSTDDYSVMYVASPIYANHQLIGVVSVGKSVLSLMPYISTAKHEFLKIIMQSMLFSLILAALIAAWLRHSIQRINRYTQSLGQMSRPHFYLGRELNELTHGIHTMQTAIENKAYVTDYVHTLTHELKSPLTAIRASSEILLEPVDDDERQHFAALIQAQSMRMGSLIDKLLTLAKTEQPDFRLEKTLVDIRPLLIQSLNTQLASREQAHDNPLKWAIIGNAMLSADAFWLQQAIDNLINNALRHATSFVLIVIQARQIMIINDSAPLPDYVLTRAFERYFSRHDVTGKNATKGTGLGLPLVASIMAAHGGTATLTQSRLDATLAQAAVQMADVAPDFHGTDDANVIVVRLLFSES